jgi:hypothetical protein
MLARPHSAAKTFDMGSDRYVGFEAEAGEIVSRQMRPYIGSAIGRPLVNRKRRAEGPRIDALTVEG